jgi:MFS family permease
MRSRKINGLRWWMIGLLMLGSIINYLTRSTLAVAAPTLTKDLGISEREYSWIVATFQGAIMFQPICGYVLDVIGLKIVSQSSRSRGRLFAWRMVSLAVGRRLPDCVRCWALRKAAQIPPG